MTANHGTSPERPVKAQEQLTCTVSRGASPARHVCERALAAVGHPLPLEHRSNWEEMRDPDTSWFLQLHDPAGGCVLGCAVDVARSRALPGHQILRVPKFGTAAAAGALPSAVRELATIARHQSKVLRLHLEVFSREPEVHDAVAAACTEAGFEPVRPPRNYEETAIIDLTPDLDDIFDGLHSTGRRHVRAVNKNPVELRLVDQPAYAARLAELLEETLERTGGTAEDRDWARIMEFCQRHPRDARLVGLYHRERSGPASLLAYALGYNQGDHVQYSTAASTRDAGVKMPLAYSIAWDLVKWAKGLGVGWFDFGGITRGSHDDPDDARGGISDFKRYFTRDVVRVGSEWVLDPNPSRARFARLIGTAAATARRFLQRSS